MIHLNELSPTAQATARTLKRRYVDYTSGLSHSGVFAKKSGRGHRLIAGAYHPGGKWERVQFYNEDEQYTE